MNPLWNRVLKAYRPLHQRGMLMDGPYRWPPADESDDSSKAVSSRRPRILLAALTLPGSTFPFRRNIS